jgi:NitT/TauT family transport system permease protein
VDVDMKMKSSHLVRALTLLVGAGIWEIASRCIDEPLLLPTFTATAEALLDAFKGDGVIFSHINESLIVLLTGFAIGSILAIVVTVLAMTNRSSSQALAALTATFSPLPAVAIFPIALMWLGINAKSMVFVAGFASFFPVSVSVLQGLRSVSETTRFVGMNFGLRGISFVIRILIPASLTFLLSGLRSGFANGFRALIAVEMVIGAASGKGGLGWYLMANKQNLEIPSVYAGIICIMLIGLFFEAFFHYVEKVTVERWGMLR